MATCNWLYVYYYSFRHDSHHFPTLFLSLPLQSNLVNMKHSLSQPEGLNKITRPMMWWMDGSQAVFTQENICLLTKAWCLWTLWKLQKQPQLDFCYSIILLRLFIIDIATHISGRVPRQLHRHHPACDIPIDLATMHSINCVNSTMDGSRRRNWHFNNNIIPRYVPAHMRRFVMPIRLVTMHSVNCVGIPGVIFTTIQRSVRQRGAFSDVKHCTIC